MIGIDKQAHFWAGLAICLAVALFFGGLIGLGVAIVFGIGKEVVDSFGYGTPDKWDAISTVIGGCIGCILYIINTVVMV